MGAGLGVALRMGGHDVATTLAGRSERTRRLVADAGLTVLPGLAEVVAAARILLVVTPPGAAVDAAHDIAAAAKAAQQRPLVADLNAISPTTAQRIESILRDAGLDLVDGAISGPPPSVRPGARIYLSGLRAPEIDALGWVGVETILLGGPVGQASAVKMCTASVYKGLAALVTQAMRTADHYGVLNAVMADFGGRFADPDDVARAATKADRYVAEMREIASTQRAAGLTPALFEAFAEVYADIAETPVAEGDPEAPTAQFSAAEVANALRRLP